MQHAAPYCYVLIRQDIPLEHQITQACHAALEAGFDAQRPGCNTTRLITLGVKSKDHLEEMSRKLDIHGIGHHMFFEPDNDMGYSALATHPIVGEDRRHFKNLKLWRPQLAA